MHTGLLVPNIHFYNKCIINNKTKNTWKMVKFMYALPRSVLLMRPIFSLKSGKKKYILLI